MKELVDDCEVSAVLSRSPPCWPGHRGADPVPAFEWPMSVEGREVRGMGAVSRAGSIVSDECSRDGMGCGARWGGGPGPAALSEKALGTCAVVSGPR